MQHRQALCESDHSKPKGYPAMSNKQATAKKSNVARAPSAPTDPSVVHEAAPVAVKKVRKPKSPSMSIKTKFAVLTSIMAADPKSPDATVAAGLSVTHDRPISAQQVGKYRKELGLASVGKPKQADLLAELAAAQARIAALEAAAAALTAPAS